MAKDRQVHANTEFIRDFSDSLRGSAQTLAPGPARPKTDGDVAERVQVRDGRVEKAGVR
jgi:hypothetical protein